MSDKPEQMDELAKSAEQASAAFKLYEKAAAKYKQVRERKLESLVQRIRNNEPVEAISAATFEKSCFDLTLIETAHIQALYQWFEDMAELAIQQSGVYRGELDDPTAFTCIYAEDQGSAQRIHFLAVRPDRWGFRIDSEVIWQYKVANDDAAFISFLKEKILEFSAEYTGRH